MIALNETDEAAAEVAFTLPLASDPLTGLTGYVWALGEVQIRLPGAGSWVDAATIKIIEKGYGRFAVRLSSGQCTTAGTVAIYATVTTPGVQPYLGTETIGTTGGDISEGGTGYLMFYLADAVDPVYGAPLTGTFSTLPGALARVCWPDSVYATVAASSVVEFGFGLYGIPVTAGDAVRGKAYYYAEATDAQRFESYSTILTAQEVIAAVTPTDPDPIEVVTESVQATVLSHTQAAWDRLCEYAKQRSA